MDYGCCYQFRFRRLQILSLTAQSLSDLHRVDALLYLDERKTILTGKLYILFP